MSENAQVYYFKGNVNKSKCLQSRAGLYWFMETFTESRNGKCHV